MEKTYSQKVARVFEIICCILLIPTCFGLIYPVFFIIGGLMGGNTEVFLYGLLPFIIVGVGVVLLVGYFKHSRGRLDEKYISTLWMGTAVYNFLLLLPFLYAVADGLQSGKDFIRDGNLTTLFIVLSIISGYISAIIFALKARAFENRKKLY